MLYIIYYNSQRLVYREIAMVVDSFPSSYLSREAQKQNCAMLGSTRTITSLCRVYTSCRAYYLLSNRYQALSTTESNYDRPVRFIPRLAAWSVRSITLLNEFHGQAELHPPLATIANPPYASYFHCFQTGSLRFHRRK